MELLDGQDMRAVAPLPYRDACRYLREVAASLALLHARRLIHRDLSPGNVRLTPGGHCKLLDFGALSAFGNSRPRRGDAAGHPARGRRGAPLDQRSDLYSLGALAYWILTRRHAYPAKEIAELDELWKKAPPPPSALVPGIPKDLDTLVLTRSLSSDPLARPPSAAEVIAGDSTSSEAWPRRRAATSSASPRASSRAHASSVEAAKLEQLEERTDALLEGKGSALRIRGGGGWDVAVRDSSKRSACRAQIAGASVLRVDASTYPRLPRHGPRLAVRLLDALPHLSRECARRFSAALGELGREVEGRLVTGTSSPPPIGLAGVRSSVVDGTAFHAACVLHCAGVLGGGGGGTLDGWFAEVSRSAEAAGHPSRQCRVRGRREHWVSSSRWRAARRCIALSCSSSPSACAGKRARWSASPRCVPSASTWSSRASLRRRRSSSCAPSSATRQTWSASRGGCTDSRPAVPCTASRSRVTSWPGESSGTRSTACGSCPRSAPTRSSRRPSRTPS